MPSNPLSRYVARYPAGFWVLAIGAFVNRVGSFVVPYLTIYFTQELHLTAAQGGLLISLWGIGSLASGPLGGMLSDRIGYWRSLPLVLVLGAAAMLQLGFARSITHLAISIVCLGLVGDLYRPAVQSAIADIVAPERRSEAFSLLYWFINLGFTAAMLVAAYLARLGFLTLFVIDAATTLGFALVIAVFLKKGTPHRSEETLDFGRPLRDPLFLAVVATAWLVGLVFLQHAVTLPLAIVQAGLPKESFGKLIAINGLLIVLCQPFLGRVLARLPWWLSLALSDLFVGIGFGATGLAHTQWAFAGTIAVWTMGEMLMAPVHPTVISALAPAGLRATYQGFFQLAWGAATLVGPTVGTQLLSRFGGSVLWGVCFCAGCVALLSHLILGRLRPKLPG